MGSIKIKVAGITCVAPKLIVNIIGGYTYQLDWDYDGVDYSAIDPTTTVTILFSKGSSASYNIVEVVPFTTQTYIINDSAEANTVAYFMVNLVNRTCNEYSNEVGIIHT